MFPRIRHLDRNESRQRLRALQQRKARLRTLEQLEPRQLLAADATLLSYDVSGNVAAVRDGNGHETTFAFNDLGQLTGVQGAAPGETASYAYDANGNLVQMTDPAGHTFYDYDPLDRLLGVTRSQDAIQGNADDQRITYAYDAAGNIDTLTYPDATVVDYDYDAANRLTRVAEGSQVTSYTWFADGQLQSSTLPNGIVASYQYDAAGRLDKMEYVDGDGQLVSSFQYSFDANRNRTSMEVRRPDLGTPATDDFVSGLYQYTYDARSQLTEARYPDGSVVTYTYDGVGNRTSMATDPDGAGPQAADVRNFHYTIENRLSRITDGGGVEVARYQYDGNGNRTAEITPSGTTTYQYDYRDLLTRVDDGTTVIQYQYDGNGDRIARTENGTTTTYINDPNQAYTQVLAQFDTGGNLQGRYTYGLGRISGLLPGQSNPVIYVNDALGSATDLTDATGAALASFSYDAFGSLRTTDPVGGSGSLDNNFLFAGEDMDPDTGLVYLRARYYDPETGRFLSKDPAGFVDGPNQYVYAGSNPVNNVDPSGEIAFALFAVPVVIGGLATGGISAVSSYLNGDSWDVILNEGAKGTIQGTVGTATSIWASLAGGPAAGVLGGSAASAVTGESIDWIQGNGFSVEDATVEFGANAIGGYVGGKLANKLIPNVPGRNPDIFKLRNSVAEVTQKGWDYLNREAIGEITGAVVSGGAKPLLDSFRPSGFGPFGDALPQATTGQGCTLITCLSTGAGISLAPPTPANDRGGVLLDKAVDLVGNISSIRGATIDPATGQVVLLGEQQASVPELLVDDFVAAMRAVFGSTEAPGVSIDQPTSGNPADPQTVRVFAGLEDTHLGYVFFEADRVMKMLAAGKDNLTQQPVSSNVSGYASMAQRWHDSGTSADIRWWFKIADMKLVRSADGQSFEFNDVGIQLVAEDAATGQPATDADALAFAEWFTDNFDAIAAEAYPYPSLAGMSHPLLRLKQAAESVALARFLRDNQIDVDFSWINHFQLPFVDTPETTPTVTVVTTSTAGTSTFYGGIDLAELNEYLADNGGNVQLLVDDARDSRPGQADQTWLLSDNATDAIALSLDAAPRDGNLAFSDLDLVTPTLAAFPLTVSRHYNSFEPVDGPLGYGWQIVPAELTFERPAFVRSGDTLNGLREGTVRLLDHETGRALSFETSLSVTYNPDGSAAVSGLSGGLPSYVAGDLFDGSILVILGDKSGYTLDRPDGSQWVFDAEGRMLSRQDRNGNTLTYAYSGTQLNSISDATGAVYTFTYDGNDRIGRIDSATGDRVDYAYDAAGNLQSATRERGGRKFTYQYDADHRMSGAVGPDGRPRFTADSDIYNRATVRTDARGNTSQWNYDRDAAGQQVSTVEDVVSGLTAQTQLDALNRPTSVSDVLGRTSQFSYAPGNGLRGPESIQLPDPGRPEIRFTYDAQGRVATVFDPANDPDGNDLTQQFFYDAAGNLTRHVDARELETLYQYDGSNNLTRAERAGTVWQYDYTTAGQLQTITDPLGHTTTYSYDAVGNVTQIQDAAGGTTQYQYDALYRLSQVTDPVGRAIQLQYDDLDRITRITAPQGETTFEYDPTNHQLVRQTDFGGNATDYTYDPATGDVLTVSTGGQSVEYQYDRFGNIVSLVDAGGTQTVFEYDELHRLVAVRTGFDDLVAGLRDTEQPWTVIEGTLVVAGSDSASRGDSILLDNDAGVLTLVVNLESFSLEGLAINAIYVDAGAGDDLVDLRSAPAGLNSTVLGGDDDDILLAGAGNDFLQGQAGYDWLEGGGGNDWLRGGKDSDVLLGHGSSVRQLFVGEGVTVDRLAGGGGDDLLFSRQGDMVTAGAGRDEFYGSQPDGTYRHWDSRDIPFGLGGRLLLLGDDAVNNVTIKNYGDKLFVTIDDYTRILDVAAFDFLTGLFQQILVLPAGGSDFLDATESPVPIFFFGADGNDVAWASADADQLIGGAGDDDLQGREGDDTISDGRGVDAVDGGGGENIMLSTDDGAVDTFRGGSARNYYVATPSDQLPDRKETDTRL